MMITTKRGTKKGISVIAAIALTAAGAGGYQIYQSVSEITPQDQPKQETPVIPVKRNWDIKRVEFPKPKPCPACPVCPPTGVPTGACSEENISVRVFECEYVVDSDPTPSVEVEKNLVRVHLDGEIIEVEDKFLAEKMRDFIRGYENGD